MKTIAIIFFAFVICAQAYGTTESDKYPEFTKPKSVNAWPLDFCSVQSAVTGFFTGTESDPDFPNSRCVTRFPNLQDQFLLVVNSVNATLLIPTNFVRWTNNIVGLIVAYAQWQNYCVFATLFTRLDNTVQTREGLITALSRGVFQSEEITTQWTNIQQSFSKGECFTMFRAAGRIFSIILDFNVPEDIV
ncbi:unnamed protein product [Moneuplotes crassus]|uniref:Uncharacterized protein n=1 Tax=Euplotes crassus TaxID=5936 RepID=A0AAD1XI53_EUPCR|nr:unnamed protein product [Moneuplotes crassus]